MNPKHKQQVLLHNGSYARIRSINNKYYYISGRPSPSPLEEFLRRGKIRGRLPSSSIDSSGVGELGQLCREAFPGIWISPPSSDGCPKVGRKSTISTPGGSPGCTGTGGAPLVHSTSPRRNTAVLRTGLAQDNEKILGLIIAPWSERGLEHRYYKASISPPGPPSRAAGA